MKRRNETENMRAVAKMKMEGSALVENLGCDGRMLSEWT